MPVTYYLTADRMSLVSPPSSNGWTIPLMWTFLLAIPTVLRIDSFFYFCRVCFRIFAKIRANILYSVHLLLVAKCLRKDKKFYQNCVTMVSPAKRHTLQPNLSHKTSTKFHQVATIKTGYETDFKKSNICFDNDLSAKQHSFTETVFKIEILLQCTFFAKFCYDFRKKFVKIKFCIFSRIKKDIFALKLFGLRTRPVPIVNVHTFWKDLCT